MNGAKTFVGLFVRDGWERFEYEVLVERSAAGFAWTSIVRAGGELRGRPTGTVICPTGLPDEVVEVLAREAVESSIRDRIGVG